MTQIKICGLSRPDDIACVNRLQPDYIGFILHFPKSKRNISPEKARELRQALRPGIRAVGVIVDQPPETAEELSRFIGLDVIQLHGNEDDAYIAALHERTHLPVWKAFRVRSREDLERAESSSADRILLDSGYGSGETFDWALASSVRRPYMLAGGLTPENAGEAVQRLHPLGLDVSSGVETNGFKDAQKIAVFIAAVRKGNAYE